MDLQFIKKDVQTLLGQEVYRTKSKGGKLMIKIKLKNCSVCLKTF